MLARANFQIVQLVQLSQESNYHYTSVTQDTEGDWNGGEGSSVNGDKHDKLTHG